MKKLVSLSMVSALSLTAVSASVFAADMMDSNSMMMKSNTMVSTSVKADTKMKAPSSSTKINTSVNTVVRPSSTWERGVIPTGLKYKTVAAVSMHLGYNWRNDRSMLATMAGIEDYRGSVWQNIAIKKYLLSVNNNGVMV